MKGIVRTQDEKSVTLVFDKSIYSNKQIDAMIHTLAKKEKETALDQINPELFEAEEEFEARQMKVAIASWNARVGYPLARAVRKEGGTLDDLADRLLASVDEERAQLSVNSVRDFLKDQGWAPYVIKLYLKEAAEDIKNGRSDDEFIASQAEKAKEWLAIYLNQAGI